MEGESACFACVLSHDNVKVAWHKNGVKLLQSISVDITSSGCEHKIKFNDVTLDDNSEISIVAENLKVASFLLTVTLPFTPMFYQGKATLTVQNIAIDFTKRLIDVHAVEGDTVMLECELNIPNVRGEIFLNFNDK